MRTNRNKAISHYQKEANLLRDEYEDYDEEDMDANEIPPNEGAALIATEPVETPSASQAAQPASAESAQEPQAASEEPAPESTGEQEGEAANSSAPAICPHVLSVYETVMLIQLKRMIKRNTKAFAVMLKILIQGDPKRKK